MVMSQSYYEDHQKEIRRLNKIIRKLEKENKRLVTLLENNEDVY